MQSQKNKYKFLEEVALADIAYEAYGKDLEEVFANAAEALFSLSADLKTVELKEKIEFKVEADTEEHLLYDFLSEILYLKDAKYMLFKEIKIKINEIKDSKNKFLVSAELNGEKIDPQKHDLDNDIKAVTMHMFSLKKEDNGYKATVVVDL